MKHFYYYFFISLSLIFAVVILMAPVAISQSVAPEREFRASWVTTAWALDWPSDIGSSPAEQKEELTALLDVHQQQNLNAIVFQVSARGDAIYPSEQLPWSYVLSGQPGEDPGWDPLQYLIEETHKRGLEFHAWYNVYSIAYNSFADSPEHSEQPNIRFTHPEWIASVTDELDNVHLWLNPGIPEAREWQVQNIKELAENYDIDAIHFDRIRYFSDGYNGDEELFEQHNPDQIENIDDWRRNNITEFVREASEVIRGIDPMIKIGAAVSGHYDEKSSGGWPARYGYHDVFADSRHWAEEGYVDYLSPMNYWSIGTPPRFEFITQEWAENAPDHTEIYMGIGAYKADVYDELHQQIDVTREAGVSGQLFYRYRNIDDVSDQYNGRYVHPVLIPEMPFRPDIEPPVAENLHAAIESDSLNLTWVAPDDSARYKYAVYSKSQESGPEWILLGLTGETQFSISTHEWQDGTEAEFAVRTLSRNYIQSNPAKINKVITSAEDAPVAKQLQLDQNFPNPFNPATQITFHLTEPNETNLSVYDITGRKIATLVDESLHTGTHHVQFDASGLSSGIYFYRLQSGSFESTRRMTLIK